MAILGVDDFVSSTKQIADVFEAFWAREEDGTLKPDFEYAIIDGVVNVGRLYPFDRFVLGTSKPGRLAVLEWRRRSVQALEGDDVEIETYAVGVNSRDIINAMGLMQTHEDSFRLEGSGVVLASDPG